MAASCAPVVLLAYKRPEHTRRVFQAIREARPAVFIAVMDGPKAGDQQDHALVEATREALDHIDWPCEFHQIYAESNLGLKRRVSSGLDEVFTLVDEAIILEDDCVPSPSFFPYATELLERYRTDDRVGLISGAQRLRGRWETDTSYLFSRDVRIWGWATWSRTWKAFAESGDLDATWTAPEANNLGTLFAPGPRRRSMVSMMTNSGRLDSWALPFAVHCARKGYLNPIPRENLVHNIGLGDGSTHTGFENYVVDVPPADIRLPLMHPSEVDYVFPVDEWESSTDSHEFYTYPLRHPLDTVRRFWRYALKRLEGRRGRQPL